MSELLLPQSAYRTFFTIMLIVLAAYALRSVLYFIITYWGHTFGIRVEADIRAALFGHMQELGFEFFDRNRTGQLMFSVSRARGVRLTSGSSVTSTS